MNVDLCHNFYGDIEFELSEVSRGHSNPKTKKDEGPNTEVKTMKRLFVSTEGVAEADRENYQAHGRDNARKAGGIQ